MPDMKQCVLVTGGTGFIGSHTIVELYKAGYDIISLDNLSNSSQECMNRVEQIVGCKIPFYIVDLLDAKSLDSLFIKHKIDHVIHFAALKSVSESTAQPLRYYENNLTSLLNLIKVMTAHNVKNFVFSSSCTVYGDPKFLPLTESHDMGDCVNPYGSTKFFSEIILKDVAIGDPTWNIVSLRYFNPVGAHVTGLIGEDPIGVPSNLMPYVVQVAVGKRPSVNVYGDNYETRDGTGIRDYIHVVDLAKAHVDALKLFGNKNFGLKAYNLGTGKGYSVLEMIKAMERASGKKIPYIICPRRDGDTAEVYADASLAEKELGWKAQYGIDKMCEDLWNWQVKNPNGYVANSPAGDI